MTSPTGTGSKMTKGPCIVYVTANYARIGWMADPPHAGQVVEARMARGDHSDDHRRFAELLEGAKVAPEYLILCVPRTRAAVRFLRFPSWDEREIQRMVEYELNTIFPYKAEEFVSGYALLEKLPGGYTQVIVTAALRSEIGKHIDFLKGARLRPDEVWVSTQALCRAFLARTYAGDSCLVHADDGFAEVLCFRGGTLIFDRAVVADGDGGYETSVTLALLREMGFTCGRLIVAGTPGPGLEKYIRRLSGELGCAVEADPALSVINGLPVHPAADGRIDLLPQELKDGRISSARRKKCIVLAGVFLLNVFLLLNLVYVRQALQCRYLEYLSGRIRTMDAETTVLQGKLARLRQYDRAAGAGRYKLGLLCELAAACPAEALLDSLDIGGTLHNGTMTAAGKARDADAVLRFASALKGSGMVATADVNSISKRSDSGGWVDFEIRARY